MPQVGGIYIPDEIALPAPVPQRPGVGDVFGAAARGAYGQLRYGLPYQAAKLSNDITPEEEAAYQQGLAETAAAAARAAPAGVSDVTSGRVGIGRFIAENLAASVPYMVGSAAGAAGGAALGSVVPGLGTAVGAIGGAVVGGVPQFSASNVARAVEEQGGLSEQAAGRALATAPLQSAADAAIGRFLPGVGKVLGGAAASQTGGFLKRTATSMLKAAGTEAVTEAAQQVGERYAAGLSLSDSDAAGEYVNAAATAFAVGGVLGAGGGFRRHPSDIKPPSAVTNEDMTAKIDAALSGQLALPAPSDFIAGPAGVQVNPSGTVQQALPSPQMFGREPGVFDPPVVVDAAGRASTDPAALMAAPRPTDNLDLSPEQIAAIPQAPLALPAPAVPGGPQISAGPTMLVDAAERASIDQTALLAAPRQNNQGVLQERLDAAKKGLRGGWVQSLEATSEADLLDKVHKRIFEDQDTAKNVQTLAQRLGILDEKLEPTPLATQIEAARTATQEQLQTEVPAVPRVALTPAAPTLPEVAIDSEASVMQRLATDTAAKRPGDASAVEKEARRLGLVTDDDAMDITPKGREAFLRTADAPAAVALAAEQQGLDTAQAPLFDRGVQAQISGAPDPEFSNFTDLHAYTAGKVWAQDFVANGETLTAEQTRAVQARQAARETVEGAPTGTGERRTLNPAQIQQQSLNRLLDAADLRGVSDGDMATMIRAVRAGGTPQQIGEMIQHVQQGGTLFTQPETQQVTLTPVQGRGQPLFKEMNTPERGPGRAANRAETDKAIAAKRNALRDEVDAAFASQDITPVERIKLLHRLAGNDFAGVADRLPGGPLADRMDVSRRGFLNGVAASAVAAGLDTAQAKAAPLVRTAPAAQFRAYVTSGNIPAALQHLAEHSSNAIHRTIARKLIAGGGWEGVTMSSGPDQGSLYGTTGLNPDGTSSVELYGEHGFEEETVLHELIHAYVQQRWAGLKVYTAGNRELLHDKLDRSDKVVKDFQDLWSKLGTVMDRAQPGIVDKEAWAGNVYSNPDEALSWLLTNKQAQAFMRGIDEDGNKVALGEKSLWTQFVDWVRGIIGLPPSPAARTALDNILDAGYSILDAGKDVRTGDFGKTIATALAGQMDRLDMQLKNAKPAETSDMTQQAAQVATQALDKAAEKLGDLGRTARRAMLPLISRNQLDRQYGHIPGLVENTRAHELLAAVRNKFELIGANALQNIEKLQNSKIAQDRGDADRINRLMEGAQYGLDGSKAWEAHEHLQSEANVADLKARHEEMRKDWDNLVRHKTVGVFTEAQAANVAQNLAHMVTQLYNRTALDPEYAQGVAGGGVSPAEGFLGAGINDGHAAEQHWKGELDQRLAAVRSYITAQKGAMAALSPKDQADMRTRLSPLEGLVGEIHRNLAKMAEQPYFHLPRFGEHFAAFTIKRNNGMVDPKALRVVAQRLADAGFDDVQLSTDNTNPRVMMRTDNWSQAKQLGDLAVQLQKEGHLDPDVPVLAAPRSRDNNFGMGDRVPDYITKAIDGIENDPVFQPDGSLTKDEREALEKQKQAAIRAMMDGWLDAQPSNSLSRVLAKRKNVQGASNDMIRGFAHRQHVGASGVAATMMRPEFAAAARQMRTAVEESAEVANPADPVETRDVVTEVLKREASNPISPFADTFDKVRAAAHSYFLGLNLSSAVINTTALGTTVLPELAKKNGYVTSFHAMRRAAPQALAILNAARKDAGQRGLQHAADLSLTENVLRAAKIPEGTRELVRQMEARGMLDLGTMSRVLGQFSEGRGTTGLDTYMRYSSAFNIYSETFARLVAVIAANDMHAAPGSSEARGYASQVVKDSLFEFQPRNVARALGKQGVLGPVTPIVTQFMQWNLQVLEKLYTEFRGAAGGEKESMKYLAGHMAAVTALTGTLGLPFATVFASLIEKLFGDDDDPFDATAEWRGFLTDVLGKDMGEVAARGLPRALGADISQRAGEASILPFSEFLADKRGWREAAQSAAGSGLGAGPSMAVNVLEGGSKLMDGDLLGGLKAALPSFLKNPVEAYRMSEEGYIDTKGNKLPLSPKASDILWQLVGFQPAEKAEYGEARQDQAARRGELTRRAGRLRMEIKEALTTGDTERARGLITDAMAFDQANPAFAVIPSLAGSLERDQRARAQAAATRAPIGVSMKDLAGQSLTQYANVNYAQ